jgi:acyl dehydratase
MTAWALGAILNKLALPDGAIHSSQELETLGGAKFPAAYRITADLGKSRQRGNLVFLTVSYSLADTEGRLVQRGKSTVLSSARSDGRSVAEARSRPVAQGDKSGLAAEDRGVLGPLRTISQDHLNAYAYASGDHNPLHLDASFAEGTQFGGIIAHGMLTLGFVGELMTAVFGQKWLNTGALNVRFRGPAYLGDKVSAWCKVSKPSNEKSSNGNGLVVCSIGVLNERSGEELITGTATVTVEAPIIAT